jgi:ribonuclease T2
MAGIVVRTAAFAIFLLAAALSSAPGQERAQDRGQERSQERRGQHLPGQFDFYVLALSWSPSFCQDSEERGRESREQCGVARPYSFVVHGLWPQYERGFPQSCQQPAPRLNRELMESMLDVMPASRLIYHEWDAHGTCSGLRPQAYFDLIRKARDGVKIPEAYATPKATLTVSPSEVEDAFVKSNPGLPRDGIAVTCGGNRLSEVRICLSKDLQFRNCPQIDRQACRRDRLLMPPVRGG